MLSVSSRERTQSDLMILTMRKFALFGVCAFCLSTAMSAQQPAWPPTADHITLPLWPGAAPGAQPNPKPEGDTTTAKDHLVAGKRVIRIGNVSTPTLTVYSPKT